MHENEDRAASTLGRRSLLKKGAAVAALGLATPLTVDSFFAPAAACSGSNITPTVHFPHATFGEWRSNTDSQSAYVTPGAITPVVGDGRMFVIFTFNWHDTGSPTAVGANSVPTIALSDTAGSTYVEHVLHRYYVHLSGTNHPVSTAAFMAVYSAPVTGTDPRSITVTLTDANQALLDPNADSHNFIAHVVQLTASEAGATPAVVGTPDTAVSTASQPKVVSITLDPAPSTAAGNVSGELVVFGSFGQIQTVSTADPGCWPPSGQLAQTFSDGGTGTPRGAEDLSLQTSWLNVAATGAVSKTHNEGSAGPPFAPTRAGAVALEINC